MKRTSSYSKLLESNLSPPLAFRAPSIMQFATSLFKAVERRVLHLFRKTVYFAEKCGPSERPVRFVTAILARRLKKPSALGAAPPKTSNANGRKS